MLDIPDLRRRMRNPETRVRACLEFGDWFRGLCLTMGVELDTAARVGAIAAIGMEREFATREQKEGAAP